MHRIFHCIADHAINKIIIYIGDTAEMFYKFSHGYPPYQVFRLDIMKTLYTHLQRCGKYKFVFSYLI